MPFPTVGSTSGPHPPSPSQHLAATTEATSPAMTVHLILQQSHEGHLGTETPDSSCSLQTAHVGRLVIRQQGQDSEVSAETSRNPILPWGVQTLALPCYVLATLGLEVCTFGAKDVKWPLLYQVEERPANTRMSLEPRNVAVCGN